MSKTIFITGASSGLGRATALLFARRGWAVIATARTRPDADRELNEAPRMSFLPLDVTDRAAVEEAAAQALALGPVDLVFANAGYALGGPTEGMSDNQLVTQIETNLLGPIRTVRAFLPHFRERGAGGFLVTTSTAGYIGMPLLSAYSATKFGLVGWAEALAYELPEGVSVRIITPGSMKTGFLQSAQMTPHPAYSAVEDRANRFYAGLAESTKDATPEIVAEAVWDAAHDHSGRIGHLVTREAREMVGARETMGAEGYRDTLLARLEA